MKLIIINLLFFLFLSLPLVAQIEGTVLDKKNQPISYANVLLKQGNSLAAFAITGEDGSFSMETPKVGTYELVVSSISFSEKKVSVSVQKANDKLFFRVVLDSKKYELEEVVIKYEQPIIFKNDTIVFNAKAFAKGNEKVAEDLLAKLPGVSVSKEGVISVGGQEVEKVMIEGDDFFRKGYKMLTKNMPASPIDKVEVYKHYSENPLLKDMENSEKIALNIKLKKDFKNVWFGRAYAQESTSFKNYFLNGNAMNVGKKQKYFFYGNLNNSGNDPMGNARYFVQSLSKNDAVGLGSEENLSPLISSQTPYIPVLDKGRTRFNQIKLGACGSKIQINKKAKLGLTVIGSHDENEFFGSTINKFELGSFQFTSEKSRRQRNKKKMGIGEVELKVDISKQKLLESVTKFSVLDNNFVNHLTYNEDPVAEVLNNKHTSLDHKTVFTHKMGQSTVFLLSGRYFFEKLPENYIIDKYYLAGLFPNSPGINTLRQQVESRKQLAGLFGRWIRKMPNKNIWEVKAGGLLKNNWLKTDFGLIDSLSDIIYPSDYQNKLKYSVGDFYLKPQYRLKYGKLTLSTKVGLHQIISIENNKSIGFVNVSPGIGAAIKINRKNNVVISYVYNEHNTGLETVTKNYILTGFNSFVRGGGFASELNSSLLSLRYMIGSAGDSFYANTFVMLTKNYNFLSKSSFYSANYSYAERIILRNNTSLVASTEINQYLRFISTNAKFTANYSLIRQKNKVNDASLRAFDLQSLRAGVEMRSVFDTWINYNFGTKWSVSSIRFQDKKSVSNFSFLDLYLDFSSKFSVTLKSERYFLEGINRKNNAYYFLDFYVTYTVKKNKLSFTLSGDNLLDNQFFELYNFDDFSSTKARYEILPRSIALGISYRF